jgi:hypothetical protein
VIGAGQLNPTSVEGGGDNPDRASTAVSRATRRGQMRLYPNPVEMEEWRETKRRKKRRDKRQVREQSGRGSG